MSRRRLRLGLTLLAACCAFGDIAEAHDPLAKTSAPSTVAAAPAQPGVPSIPGFGGPFRLTDHTGVSRTEADFHGKLMLVIFGFTNCPDVCPVELMGIAEALDSLGAMVAAVTPVFITVDPHHDTPERMAAFVGQFHPAIIGLTGGTREIADVIRKYRVHVMLAAGDDPSRTGHSSFMYLMGRDGGFISLIMPGATPEEIAARIAKYAQ
ncbi:MAG: SCO family protein [Proteobacteria bacterium]|nr:SCO family protein [Pseudomonadota bacterium]